MNSGLTNRSDYSAIMRNWLRQTPWYRRLSARTGLEGKLVVCFVCLLGIILSISCFVFISESRRVLGNVLSEQARQLVSSLSISTQDVLAEPDYAKLEEIGRSLIKSRSIMYVAYFNSTFRPVAFSHRDPDFTLGQLAMVRRSTETILNVQHLESPVFGEYIEVMAPVVRPASLNVSRATSQLLGYVTVGMSYSKEYSQLSRVNGLIVLIGLLSAIGALPMAYLLVRRIFMPIRQLVTATNKIARGQLETGVAIDRPDVIGELARSFNEMVRRVKDQQQALADANHQLEEKVLHRTAQLEDANKRLSNEISEKEDFLRAVSHDLNAPLRNIGGMATMLLMKHREHFDDEVVHRLERIQKNVDVETNLIGELLELSRIKTRRLKIEPVEIEAMLHDLAGMFDQDLSSRRIKLLIDTRLPVLQGEKSRLRQVFQNLIDNAIKYMGDGEIREIHVGCTLGSSAAEFYVADTGIGIEPGEIDNVFRVFRRGKSAAVQQVSGKGVGLASVKSIIETYDGSIRVESRLGKGTTFRFSIHGRFVPALAGVNIAGEVEIEPAQTEEEELVERSVLDDRNNG